MMHLVFLSNQKRFGVDQKNKMYWHISAECLVEIHKISANFVLEQEGISVECQLPACRQSMLHSKQVLTHWELGGLYSEIQVLNMLGGGAGALCSKGPGLCRGHIQFFPLNKMTD